MNDFLFAQDIPQQFKTQSCCFHMPGTQSDPVRLQMEQTQISPSNPRCFGKEQHQNAGEIPSWIFWFAVALNIAPVFWLNQCLTMYFSAIKSMFHPFFPWQNPGMYEIPEFWDLRIFHWTRHIPGLPDVRAVDSPERLATCVEAKARLSASRRCLKWWKTRFRLPSGND